MKKDLVEKDLLADDDDGGEVSVAIDLDPDVTDLTNPFKSVLPMWSHDAKSTFLQEQNLRMIQPTVTSCCTRNRSLTRINVSTCKETIMTRTISTTQNI